MSHLREFVPESGDHKTEEVVAIDPLAVFIVLAPDPRTAGEVEFVPFSAPRDGDSSLEGAILHGGGDLFRAEHRLRFRCSCLRFPACGIVIVDGVACGRIARAIAPQPRVVNAPLQRRLDHGFGGLLRDRQLQLVACDVSESRPVCCAKVAKYLRHVQIDVFPYVGLVLLPFPVRGKDMSASVPR